MKTQQDFAAETLKQLPYIGYPIFLKPFFFQCSSNPPVLEAVIDVIEEKDGIHFVNKNVIKAETLELNQDFKNLVDSIL